MHAQSILASSLQTSSDSRKILQYVLAMLLISWFVALTDTRISILFEGKATKNETHIS